MDSEVIWQASKQANKESLFDCLPSHIQDLKVDLCQDRVHKHEQDKIDDRNAPQRCVVFHPLRDEESGCTIADIHPAPADRQRHGLHVVQSTLSKTDKTGDVSTEPTCTSSERIALA